MDFIAVNDLTKVKNGTAVLRICYSINEGLLNGISVRCFLDVFHDFLIYCVPCFHNLSYVFLMCSIFSCCVLCFLDVFHVFLILRPIFLMCFIFSLYCVLCFLDVFHVFLILCPMFSWCVPCFLDVFHVFFIMCPLFS